MNCNMLRSATPPNTYLLLLLFYLPLPHSLQSPSPGTETRCVPGVETTTSSSGIIGTPLVAPSRSLPVTVRRCVAWDGPPVDSFWHQAATTIKWVLYLEVLYIQMTYIPYSNCHMAPGMLGWVRCITSLILLGNVGCNYFWSSNYWIVT